MGWPISQPELDRRKKGRSDWEFVRIYSDEDISGTNTKKGECFNQIFSDALAGKINLIVTISVSRFARNSVDSLVTIRKLKEHGVACYFEKKGIYTFDGKYETLSKRYDAASTELDRLQTERTRFQQKDKSIGFLSSPLKSSRR